MQIAIIGSGYVGLVTGVCFAEYGIDVYVYDVDDAKIAMLRNGQPTFYEPGLQELLRRNIEEKRLFFTNSLHTAIKNTKAIFVCVGTPKTKTGEADLSQVYAVLDAIVNNTKSIPPIVLKSTVPVGTAKKVKDYFFEKYNEKIVVISNPEFLKEGAAIEDCQRPDRIVVGTDDAHAKELMKNLYAPFLRTGKPLLVMSNECAEMTKYAANGLLACRISYMNEIAVLCEQFGANIENVRAGVGTDERIGRQFLFAGLGYGGSCFPKDLSALACLTVHTDLPVSIVRATEAINENQKKLFVQKIVRYFDNRVANKHFAIWGLSFKPKTDDVREAPAFYIINKLLNLNCSVTVYDPQAMHNAKEILKDSVRYAQDMYECCIAADALILCTEWEIFRNPQFDKLKKALKDPIIFDGRNQYDLQKMKELGFSYISIGRKTIEPN